jgi:putative endonuclease
MIKIGNKGEEIATNFLKKKGYKILDRNYKTPFGEADIIAKDKDIIVFVEVKTRSNDSFGQPFESVDFRKRERLKKIALYYLKQNQIECPIRFDVVSIFYRDEKEEINYIQDAF